MSIDASPTSLHIRAVACLLLATTPSFAADEPGSRDHPLVGRYEGSSIVYYRHADFDEAALLTAPHDYSTLLDAGRPDNDRSGAEWLKLEGAVTQIRYAIPPGRSSLEVLRNYEQALAANGFEPIFSCADQDCLVGNMNDPYILGTQIDTTNGVSTAYFDHARYALLSRENPDATVHASVLTGEVNGEVTAFVTVVETKGMEGGRIVFIDAPAMQLAIEAGGRVDLYGILFDTDEATLKPESQPTLDEVAELLTGNPEMRLEIVGHTDDLGGAEYNLDLSNRRAASVVAALTEDYGIDAGRLRSSGAGLYAPVASNNTDEGRARNRRVELRAE